MTQLIANLVVERILKEEFDDWTWVFIPDHVEAVAGFERTTDVPHWATWKYSIDCVEIVISKFESHGGEIVTTAIYTADQICEFLSNK